MRQRAEQNQAKLAEKTRKYLLANLDRKITIIEVAEKVGYSGTYVKLCFREAYGMPIHKYVRRERMKLAAELLRTTDEGILEIAGRAGYENGSKFAAVFKDTFTVTPNKYRHMDEETAQKLLDSLR